MPVEILLMIIIDIGLMFWVGAQCWRAFILPMLSGRGEMRLVRQIERRYERLYALPMLLILLIANSILILIQRFPSLWQWKLLILVAAIIVAAIPFLWRKRVQAAEEVLSLIDALLVVGLLSTVVLVNTVRVRNESLQLYGVIDEWISIFALCIVVGSLLFTVSVVLPVARVERVREQTRAIVTILRVSSPLITVGIVFFVVALCGKIFLQVSEPGDVGETAYGRAAIVAGVILIAFVLDWVWCMFWVRPDVVRVVGEGEREDGYRDIEDGYGLNEEKKVVVGKQELMKVERGERLLVGGMNVGIVCGLGLLLCLTLMDMFANTIVASHPVAPGQRVQSQPYRASVLTTDGQLSIRIVVNPNRFGVNTFTVNVAQKNGNVVTDAQVVIYTTMTDMDMGTDVITLRTVAAGQYSAQGNLSMSGRWRLRIVVKSAHYGTHEISVVIDTPF